MTGRVDFAFLPTTTVLSLVNEGKLRALAVSASKRACDRIRMGRLGLRLLGRIVRAGENSP